jgi:hypothetical protein
MLRLHVILFFLSISFELTFYCLRLHLGMYDVVTFSFLFFLLFSLLFMANMLQGFVLVYSITSSESLEAAKKLLATITEIKGNVSIYNLKQEGAGGNHLRLHRRL